MKQLYETTADFKNFKKTYARYKRDYWRKARKIYKKLNPEAKMKGVTHRELKEVMWDNSGPLNKADFIAAYNDEKTKLLEQDSSADPTQYIVQRAAYKYSEAQYRAFTKAIKHEEFYFLRGMKREEFRTGSFRAEEYRSVLKKMYAEKKKELIKEKGLSQDMPQDEIDLLMEEIKEDLYKYMSQYYES